MGSAVRKLPELKWKMSDYLNLRSFYTMMHQYLLELGWEGIGGDGVHYIEKHRSMEVLYMELDYAKAVHQGGKELWFYWRLKKFMQGKPHPYFELHLDMDFQMVFIKDAEITYGGRKMKLQHGDINMRITPWIEADKQNRWKTHWLLQHFKDLYEERIMRQDLDKWEKELWREVNRFTSKLKEFIEFRSFIPVQVGFEPAITAKEAF